MTKIKNRSSNYLSSKNPEESRSTHRFDNDENCIFDQISSPGHGML